MYNREYEYSYLINRSDVVTVIRYNYINFVPFQKVVLDFLAWSGINEKGNVPITKFVQPVPKF
ncbi:hypothetical protein DDI74_01375 [Chryseobacterium gleum]|nr:hypothetical protein DDI74_01375 [Chryseobacterium gleum]